MTQPQEHDPQDYYLQPPQPLEYMVQPPEATVWVPVPEAVQPTSITETAQTTPEASSVPEVMTIDKGRQFLDLMSRGILTASRAEQETPTAQAFVQRASQRGAELAANLLGDYGYGVADGRLIGAHVQALQRADTYLYPQMEMLDRPETARPTDVRAVMERHAGQVSNQSHQPSVESRGHREDAALAVMEIMNGLLEANPGGLQLNTRALEAMQSMTRGFDSQYPEGL